MRRFLTFSAAGLLALLPLFGLAQSRSWPTDILRDTFGITGSEQIAVPIADVHQGCPVRDCIRSIDNPGFAAASEAHQLEDEDLILGLDRGGIARAYPAFILNHSEIVNDTIAGEPIAITFCPLCGSGVAFERRLDGNTVELGVSGLLHNSDLIFYDRASESLWQQITGEAIAGPHRGSTLSTVPLVMTTWKEWRTAHPHTEVLVSNQGQLLSSPNKKPYGDYDESTRLMFPANSQAARIMHPKQVVHGIRLPEGAMAVSERRLARDAPLSATIGGVAVEWQKRVDGGVTIVRSDTGESLSPHRMFWFAWYSFNTDTALLDTKQEITP